MMDREDRERWAWLAVGFTLAVLLALFAFWGCDGPTPNPPTPPPVPPVNQPTVRVYVGVYDLMGATGDVDGYLRACKDAGATGVRLFVCYSWNGPQPISPYVQVGTWKHDNGDTFPLYRLGEWNAAYWDYLHNVLTACAGHGLTAWLVAEDYCSLKGDQHTKYFNPFYSSEEALGPSTPGGVWGLDMRPYHAALYGKVMDAVKAVPGLTYLVEDMNEGWIVDGTEAQVRDWFVWSREALIAAGADSRRIVSTVGLDGVADLAAYFSPHGIGTPSQIVAPLAGQDAGGLIYSSDGFWGGTGPADANGRHGVGTDVAADIGRAIVAIGAFAFEYLPRDAYKANNDRACVDGLDLSPVKAMAYAK